MNDTVKGGDFYNLPELVEVMANGAAPALNWMIDEGGAQIRPTVTRAGGHTAYRTHSAVAGVGSTAGLNPVSPQDCEEPRSKDIGPAGAADAVAMRLARRNR